MRFNRILLSLLLVFTTTHTGLSDMAGPATARHAVSPNGKVIVRIATPKTFFKTARPVRYEVFYYAFESAKDSYTLRTSFPLMDHLSELLAVSNTGDLMMISLSKTNAIRLYANDGTLKKSWKLTDFLSEDEIEKCGKTGATLQWFDEGGFGDNRQFYFYGPAKSFRALQSSYTVMRAPDEKFTFSATIDANNCQLFRDRNEDR